MSKINVDTWEPESGTAATLMASGDTVTLPDGAILAVASGGDINVASGGEIDIASGATLDVNGTIDLTGATKTGFPAGGLSFAQQWRLNTNADIGTGETYLYANWEKGDEAADSPGEIGADMAVDSASSGDLSGAWTFPDTGVWYILWRTQALCNVGNHSFVPKIWVTEDTGSNWSIAAEAYRNGQTSQTQPNTVDYMVEISNVSTHKVRFSSLVSLNTTTILGDTNKNECSITFIKLGDAS